MAWYIINQKHIMCQITYTIHHVSCNSSTQMVSLHETCTVKQMILLALLLQMVSRLR